MQTRITARQFDASDALRNHVVSQVDSLQKYYDGIVDARVVLDNADSSHDKRAEIVIQVYRQTLAASDGAPTHESAVDACVNQLRRQILKYKDKLRGVSARKRRARR